MRRNIDESAEAATVWQGKIETRTTVCPKCGKPAGSGKFCNNCGAPLGTPRCPNCGAELVIRKDDTPETVRNRLKVYHQETEPLKDFYKSRGKLKLVDNQPTIELTTAAIFKTLGIE